MDLENKMTVRHDWFKADCQTVNCEIIKDYCDSSIEQLIR